MESDLSRRPTESFPVVQRTGLRFVQRLSRSTIGTLRDIGDRTYFLRDIWRALREPETYMPQLLPQMRAIGVDSIPITVITAAFIGAVITLQTRAQLFAGVELSLVGWTTRQSIVL